MTAATMSASAPFWPRNQAAIVSGSMVRTGRMISEMPSIYVLDTGVLGLLCHPRDELSQPAAEWLTGVLDRGSTEVALPAIADYELRRKLLHLIDTGRASAKSLDRLDEYCESLDYLDLTADTLRHAARLWADARVRGVPTAAEAKLDADVILAGQALAVGGTVVTTNTTQARFVAAKTWEELA